MYKTITLLFIVIISSVHSTKRTENSDEYVPCIPMTVFKDECNTCYCTIEGASVCTKMACIKSPHGET